MAELTKKDLNRMFFRLQGINVTNNYESMQSVGFLHAIAPALQRVYMEKTEEEIRNAMKRHLVFFNSHVNGDAFILGITAAMEENTTEDEKDTVTSLKTGLMGPLAGLGDSLIKFTWLPICGSIGASLALSGSVLGPILMFILYNIVNQGLRYVGVFQGYYKGLDFLNKNENNNIIQRISNVANVVGLMVVGALIAETVRLTIPYEIVSGENTIIIQEMFDKVMPNVLPLLFTLAIYLLFKKTKGKHTVLTIVAIMVVSIVTRYFGFL